jgi:hypothetical protein
MLPAVSESDPSSQDLLGPRTPAIDGLDATEVARRRRRQQASNARFDHALELVEKAARAAAAGDGGTLAKLIERMDRTPVDDFERHHPPSAALDFMLYDVVVSLVPADGGYEFGSTWIDALVHAADLALGEHAGRWVRLAVGMAADEFELSNQELEAIERFRGGLVVDRSANLVGTIATADPRPRAALLRDGVQALAWLRAYALTS